MVTANSEFEVNEMETKFGDLPMYIGGEFVPSESGEWMDSVNPATGTIMLKPGEQMKIPLKMHIEFEGKFKVKALNPTTLKAYSQIDLETDYTV